MPIVCNCSRVLEVSTEPAGPGEKFDSLVLECPICKSVYVVSEQYIIPFEGDGISSCPGDVAARDSF